MLRKKKIQTFCKLIENYNFYANQYCKYTKEKWKVLKTVLKINEISAITTSDNEYNFLTSASDVKKVFYLETIFKKLRWITYLNLIE